MSAITAIGTANPPYRFSQTDIASFMLRAMTLQNGDERKLKTIFRASGIAYRHSVLEDYGKTQNFSFYPEDNTQAYPSTEERLKVFRSHALALSVQAVSNMRAAYAHVTAQAITHLVVVCCTGMYAPGLDIELVHALKLPTTVQRTAITFMGCYAAFNALKVADAICGTDPKAKVLIVCTELCSLHFQRRATDDNILANALFADGSACVLVENETSSALRLRLERFHNDLAPEGNEDMAWNIGNLGFEMRLSVHVPEIIQRGIAKLTATLMQKISEASTRVKHFAIHPGGKKILEVIEQELNISKADNEAAYRVLKNYGNMSSPTVLFVLKEVVAGLTRDNRGEDILSFAFGPGLTLESMILQIEHV